MPDYSQGKIYTIRCRNDDSLVYVGSTCQKLCKRFADHRKNMKEGKNISLYKYVEDWNDWYIELYEKYQCDNNEELCRREGEIIREIGTINRMVAGRTPQEYRKDNWEHIQMRQHTYYRQNTEKFKNYNLNKTDEAKQKMVNNNKIYRANNQEKLKEYRQEYYSKYKETLLENNKKYRQLNKEKIKHKKSETIQCECGISLLKNGFNRHIKSKKHLDFIELQKDKSVHIIDDYHRDTIDNFEQQTTKT